MAGHMLYNVLPTLSNYDVYGLARGVVASDSVFNVDVSDTSALKKIVQENNFYAIINCIGILNADAEDNPSKAIWFNSYFPHYLEEITAGTETRVVHISTDCVFSGKEGNYTELDFKNGVGFYAQSKALGELDNKKDVTVRTSIIGPELNTNGIGLFHWFMKQSESDTIKGYNRAFWSGITTLELARVIDEILKQDISGLIQVAHEEKIDKYSLLQLFNNIFRDGFMQIVPFDGYQIDKSLRSVRADFNYIVPSYEQMLNDQRSWMLQNSQLYDYKLN
ncbi:dTDP-4-dehydrorhamnose reductase [Sphingobacterium paludis]|uniref:dTDP-4-dehydrorhamnose reductase n=2 Tax=Sphingobacterium paludis TaxID=1476465 RepID=A0A4R7D0F4_9SPHI|nr:dTDP-4-dehydrorhamnose reductase [Sphingobacterium paludis]